MSLLRAREGIQRQLYQSGRPGTECSAAVGLDANALQPPVFIRLIAERRTFIKRNVSVSLLVQTPSLVNFPAFCVLSWDALRLKLAANCSTVISPQ